jgi:hypothetical protein
MASLDRLTQQRTCAACDHGHRLSIGDFAHDAGVARRERSAHVAGNGRDAEQVDLGRGESEQQRDAIVDARVAIENYSQRLSR